jgi:hypothetical protein
MENALDHSRRRLHLRPEPSTPAVSRLATVLLSIILQSGRGLEQAPRALPRSFAYPSHAQRSHLLRYLVRTLADPEATGPVEPAGPVGVGIGELDKTAATGTKWRNPQGLGASNVWIRTNPSPSQRWAGRAPPPVVAFASTHRPVRPAPRWVLAARIGGLADLANSSGQ